MPKGRRKAVAPENKPIEQYTHTDKDRVNIPPVGLVTPDTDKDAGKQKYEYDPHLDPQLQWAGKAGRTSFEVPTVSLHIHERIDPRTIIEVVRKKEEELQPSLFERTELPLRQAIEFYKHRQNWTNRLIAGDSTLVMNSLLVKEGMAGQVQMIYFDPPYGIKYGSNFQPFVNRRDVKDKDEDLTQEPETLKAFRDTWELGIHSYLTYLRDRLLLARELMHESGSIFVQISDENVHLVRNLMDEVFGSSNFQAQINFKSMQALGQSGLAKVYDYIAWYAKDANKIKFHPLFELKEISEDKEYRFVDDSSKPTGYRKLSEDEFRQLSDYSKVFRRSALTSSGFTPTCTFAFELNGVTCKPFGRKSWRTNREGIEVLKQKQRLFLLAGNPYFKLYYNDFPYMLLENSWTKQAPAQARLYAVQTGEKFIQRCMLMTTDPGDLVFDPTCGSGTTAYVGEQWGRRWITCDTSRVAITLSKQRLMTANFDYYELAKPLEGVSSGFRYKTVPHVTLKSIANNEPPATETLYDQPLVDSSKLRVASPFTVEAVPAPTVQALHEVENTTAEADASIARSGETVRQADLRDELLKAGIRGRQGERLIFSRVEPLSGTRFLHADAEIFGGGGGVKPIKSTTYRRNLRVLLLVLVLNTIRSAAYKSLAHSKRLTVFSRNQSLLSSLPFNSTPKRRKT
jgi:adenine-specific DNA-methyltransferase